MYIWIFVYFVCAHINLKNLYFCICIYQWRELVCTRILINVLFVNIISL
jgi:hypothetical protein